MSELIDPETIGRNRAAREIKQGWHVDGALALHDAFVGPSLVLVDVRAADGQTRPLEFRRDQYVATRTPAEQVQYVEAIHRQLLAQAGLEKAELSARPIPPCTRPECAKTRAELGQLRRRRAAAMRTAPVPVLVHHPGVAR